MVNNTILFGKFRYENVRREERGVFITSHDYPSTRLPIHPVTQHSALLKQVQLVQSSNLEAGGRGRGRGVHSADCRWGRLEFQKFRGCRG